MRAYPIVLTNGRGDCLLKMMDSFRSKVYGCEVAGTIVDDSGDYEYRRWLRTEFPLWAVRPVRFNAAGYSAAMQTVWDESYTQRHVFLIEDDFVFTRPVFLADLISVLCARPYLAQLVLLRQAWFPNEIQHGGLIPALEAQGRVMNPVKSPHTHSQWIEHTATWSSNPTVFRGGNWVLDHPWPSGEGSEYRFGQDLFQAEPSTRVAYWGNGTEYVEHIGQRTGFGH